MVQVLVVDDSVVQRELVVHLLQSDPNIQVIDTANNGLEAIKKINIKRPDIVLMDIHMPIMGGVEAIENIMSNHPLPIIVITSSTSPSEGKIAFEAMEAGAIAILDKKHFNPEHREEIIQTVKLMAEIKVVRRFKHLMRTKEQTVSLHKEKNIRIRLIGMGASTGGPNVLQEIFSKLQPPFPPIMVVQHIPETFLEGLVEWLKQTTHQKIKVAKNFESLEENNIYFVPSEYQGEIRSDDTGLRIQLNQSLAEGGHRPSATVLFRSMSKVIPQASLGVLLTGMGRDGAEGLKILREKGGITIAQDEKSSLIYGMPGEAVALNAAKFILDPQAIAEYINSIRHAK